MRTCITIGFPDTSEVGSRGNWFSCIPPTSIQFKYKVLSYWFQSSSHVYSSQFFSEAIKLHSNHSPNRKATYSDIYRSQQRSPLFSTQVSSSWHHPWLCCFNCSSQQL